MSMLDDGLRYVGPKSWLRGYVAISLDALTEGPFRFRVRAVPKAYVRYYIPPIDRPVETFYYITWTGFLTDWKRESFA